MLDPDVLRYLGLTAVQGLTHVLPKSESVAVRGESDQPPVLFIHGLGGHRGNFAPFQAAFRLMGNPNTWAFHYGRRPLEAIAGDFAEMLAAAHRVNGNRPVDVVAFSMGGLIARYAAQRLGQTHRIRRFITMGTPHYGTYAARFARTELITLLRPGSDFLNDLNSQSPAGVGLDATCFVSDSDVMILPHESAHWLGARRCDLHGVSHPEYLLKPSVIREVYRVLGEPAPSPASPPAR
ncbi:MAG: hypothetical protein GMKNLPBB_01969 [Myxococcota bacterium]|nr:hypothetical protein [Myxococcota bacterium]